MRHRQTLSFSRRNGARGLLESAFALQALGACPPKPQRGEGGKRSAGKRRALRKPLSGWRSRPAPCGGAAVHYRGTARLPALRLRHSASPLGHASAPVRACVSRQSHRAVRSSSHRGRSSPRAGPEPPENRGDEPRRAGAAPANLSVRRERPQPVLRPVSRLLHHPNVTG